MSYETTCPKGHRLQVSDSHLGQRIQCPACNESFIVSDGGRPQTPYPPGRPERWNVSPARTSDLSRLSLLAGRPMVAVGLVLVLLSKGCDSISQHGVERAEAIAKKAAEQFDDDVKVKQLDLQQQIDEITTRGEIKPDDQKKIDDLKRRQAELAAASARDRKVKEAGEWRELEIAAREADRRPQDQRLLARTVLRLRGDRARAGTLDRQLGRARGRTLGHLDDAGHYHLQPVHRGAGLDAHPALRRRRAGSADHQAQNPNIEIRDHAYMVPDPKSKYGMKQTVLDIRLS